MLQNADDIIHKCSQFARVLIASEAPLNEEFEKYRFPISPDKMHDALHYATMYIGDGGTMATEAAVLGTPAIFISSLTAGVFDEYEKNQVTRKYGVEENIQLKKTYENRKAKGGSNTVNL